MPANLVLTHKAAKLMKLCELGGYKRIHDLLNASMKDILCPAICTGGLRPHDRDGVRSRRRVLRGVRRQHDGLRACARRSHLGRRQMKIADLAARQSR